MNRVRTAGIVSALAFFSIAGAVSAAGMHVTESGFARDVSAQPVQLIRHWKGGHIYVMQLGQVYSNGEAAEVDAHAGEHHQVAALQSAIEHNPALVSRLKAQNVEVDNIIDARTAMDGGIEFYVR